MSDDRPVIAPQTVTVSPEPGVNVANATKTGYLFCKEHGIIDLSYPNSKLRRGRVQHGGDVSPTLTCNPDGLYIVDKVSVSDAGVLEDLRLRHPTERECFRLMGLTEQEIDTVCSSPDISRNAKYRLAGNSIVVPVLEEIFAALLFDVKNESEENPDALF